MTDSTPTPPPAEQPAAPAAPAAPAYAAAGAVAAPKQTQSLVGFILGIASIVFAWTGIIGLGAGIAAIILSNRAKKNEPAAPAWMKTLGLVFGIIGIVLSVIWGTFSLIGLIISIAAAGAGYGSY